MADSGSPKRELKVLTKGFDIIELISDNPGMTLTEIAEKKEMPKSTAHIYLKTLREEGYIVKLNGRYAVSFRFLTIGGKRRNRLPAYMVAKGPMAELSSRIHEVFNVALGTEESGKRVLIHKYEGTKSPYSDVPIGHMTHLHWVSHGKALLSKFSRERVKDILESHGLPQATSKTITREKDLFDELDKIRNQGYSLEDEERVEGIRAVAVPIEGKESDPCVSLSISGPKAQISDDKIPELVDHLSRTANIIEVEYKTYSEK